MYTQHTSDTVYVHMHTHIRTRAHTLHTIYATHTHGHTHTLHAYNYLHTVWPENLTGIKFDEIASKLHNKNMTDFKFDEMPGKKAHSIRKINIDGY